MAKNNVPMDSYTRQQEAIRAPADLPEDDAEYDDEPG